LESLIRNFIGKKKTTPQGPIFALIPKLFCVDARPAIPQNGRLWSIEGCIYPSGKKVPFSSKKAFQDATNNMGEFLAIVSRFWAYLQKQKFPIFLFFY
jgi:hypothetical protein